MNISHNVNIIVGLPSPRFRRWRICCTTRINSKNTRWP